MKQIKNNRCLICDSKTEQVFKLAPSPVADLYTDDINSKQEIFDLNFNLCPECGLFQLDTIVFPEDIYNENYLYEISTSVGLEEHFFNLAKKTIQKYNLNQDSIIVDIGSNIGSLLKGYKDNGLNVLGVEPVPHIADKANKRGIKTLNNFFDEEIAKKIVLENGKADIIHANNVLANIPKLNDFMKAIKILLDENGTFIVETSYLLSLIENMVFDTFYHEHIAYFSIKPLEYLCNQNGLKLVDVEKIDTKGGSIRCFIEHNKNQKISDNLIKLKEEEIKKNLFSKETFKKYQQEIEKLKNDSLNILEEIKQKGEKIVGYGASNTTTTLMYHFELYKYIDYIVDDNPIKIGKYCPANHIPVVSSNKIYEDNIKYIYLFAWRFADVIIGKHKKFLENGGKFIIPLPELKIIDKKGMDGKI